MDFVDRLSGRAVSLRSVLKFSDIDPRVQRHLTKVYVTLLATVLVSAVGVYADLTLHIGGLLTTLGAFGALLWISFTTEHTMAPQKRLALLATFGFCQGTSLGPLVGAALDVNPALVLTATLGTSLAFASFSLASLVTKRRSYLFLGGMLSNALLSFAWLRLAGYLFGFSASVYALELYAGLLVFSGYVVYDTQLVVERAHAGDFDTVRHALDLFVDFFAIFVRVLIILLQNQERRERSRREEAAPSRRRK